MKKDTLIEHKEIAIVCEESGHTNLNYNGLLITPKANIMVELVVHVVTTKLALTCTNCGKTGHSIETCHNKKKEVPDVPIARIKSIEPIARIKTQLVKSIKIPIHYPSIICFSVEHKYGECLKKIEV
jgi:hypothetical protein